MDWLKGDHNDNGDNDNYKHKGPSKSKTSNNWTAEGRWQEEKLTIMIMTQGKYLFVALSLVLILGGLYFKFLYDVPDGQDALNRLVSWLLVVTGIGGLMASLLWRSRNPLELDDTTFGRRRGEGEEGEKTKRNNAETLAERKGFTARKNRDYNTFLGSIKGESKQRKSESDDDNNNDNVSHGSSNEKDMP